MGLFGPDGVLLASNDDADGSTAFMSAIDFVIAPGVTGLFTIAFSGFNPGLIACGDGVPECYDTDGDFVFDRFVAGGGAGGSTGWDYLITVSQVSEPSTLLLAGIALAVLAGSGRKRGLWTRAGFPREGRRRSK